MYSGRMCGINGLVGRDERAVGAMNERTRHRGPDDTGIYSSDLATIGNNRLAIIDLSPEGHQPMRTGERYSIVFNGEIYNYRELRAELSALGVSWKSHSDTEVILEGYAQWGASITKKLRGMWAFAILDEKEETLFLARDPFGIKPLYLYDDGATLAFSSEIRGLLANPKVKGAVNPEALKRLLTLGFALAPETILMHTTALLPGEEIVINLKSKKQRSHINQFEASDAPTSDEDLEAVLLDSVRHHLIADVPVGLFFSGGTDSTLLAVLLKNLGVELTTYHVAIERRGDTEYAEKIAKHLGLTLRQTTLDTKKAQEELQAATLALDHPLADTSFLPTYLVSQLASKDVKVVLSGEGGDELFGGYPRHPALMNMALKSGLRTNLPTDRLLRAAPSLLSLYGKMQGAKRLAGSLAGDAYGRYVGEIAFGSPLRSMRDIEHAMHERVSKYATPDQTLALDRLLYLPDVNLLKIDTATMAHSIEGRTPLLDREVWRRIGSRPHSWKSTSAISKSPLKRILSKYLPEELVHRPKSGFSSPPGMYFENPERLEEAIHWYGDHFAGLIPILDSLLRRYSGTQRGTLARELSYTLIVLMTIHQWLEDKNISL